MSVVDWFILGVILVGLLVWAITGRVFYTLIYFALFSLGSFIYRLNDSQSFVNAFISSFGLVDILILIIAFTLLIQKLKKKRNQS